jgi:hypothetical protein
MRMIPWKPVLITAASVVLLALGAWAIHAGAPFVLRTRVPEGTEITVRMNNSVSTDASKPGDRFTAVVAAPVVVNHKVAIPAGAQGSGHVAEAKPAGHMAGRGYIELAWDRISFRGRSYDLDAIGPRLASRTPTRKNVEWIGGGVLAGGVIGGLSGHSPLGGAVIGGAAGTAVSALTPGPRLRLSAGREVRFRTNRDLAVVPAKIA